MGGSLTVSRSFRSWSSSRCRLPARSSAASACSCRLRIFLLTASSELLPAMARRWLRLRSVSALCSCYCCSCCCSYRVQVPRVPPRPALLCRRPLRPRSSPEVTASGPHRRAAGGCARAEDGRGWQAGGAPRTPGTSSRWNHCACARGRPALGCFARSEATAGGRLLPLGRAPGWPQVENLDAKAYGDSCWPLGALRNPDYSEAETG